jgi:hypothetical protein
MHHKRFGLYYQSLKILFGESATRREKPFNKCGSIGTFLPVFRKAQQDIRCGG